MSRAAVRPSPRLVPLVLRARLLQCPRTLRRWVAAGYYYDVRTYGAVGDGKSDETAAIQRAIDAARSTNGGTVFFPDGRYLCRGILDMRGARGLILAWASASKPTTGAYLATALEYAGTSELFIDAAVATGVEFSNLFITYINPNFKGRLLSFDAPAGEQTTHALIENCTITGNSDCFRAGALVALNGTIRVAIRNCNFECANVAVRGVLPQFTGAGLAPSAFSNVVQIENCNFIQMGRTAILNAGESWNIQSSTFEYLASGGAGALDHDFDDQGRGVGAFAVSFIGCWMGDATETGTWINYCGLALTIAGSLVSGPRCVQFRNRPTFAYTDPRNTRRNAGFSATGNMFSYSKVVFDCGDGPAALGGNVLIAGNTFVGNEVLLTGALPPNSVAQLETEAFVQGA